MKLKITVYRNQHNIGCSWYFEGSKVKKKNPVIFLEVVEN